MDNVNIRKYLPKYNVKVILKTKDGERRLGFYHGGGCFILLDCTHPMQNTRLPYTYCESWQYLNECDFNLGVLDNYYERIIDGEVILKSIKPLDKTTIFQKIKYIFDSLTK